MILLLSSALTMFVADYAELSSARLPGKPDLESRSPTEMVSIVNGTDSAPPNRSSAAALLNAWPHVPFVIGQLPFGVTFTISRCMPGGTARQSRWLQATLADMIKQLRQTTAPEPQRFSTDPTEIAYIRIGEYDLEFRFDRLRAVMASGILLLGTYARHRGVAQFRGFFKIGDTPFACFEAGFNTVPPQIPQPWDPPLGPYLRFPISPDVARRECGVLRPGGQIGDGWDTIHCVAGLQSMIQDLEAKERQGIVLPQGQALVTDGGHDIFLSYQPNMAFRGLTNISMELQFIKALKTLIGQRGMLEAAIFFVNTEIRETLGSGRISFSYPNAGPHATKPPNTRQNDTSIAAAIWNGSTDEVDIF